MKQTRPRPRVARFGEVYACSPATLIVHRNEPTLIEFWNPQPDDDHDFLLMDPALGRDDEGAAAGAPEDPNVFTFHQDGLVNFTCAMHQPAMNGQILVATPVGR